MENNIDILTVQSFGDEWTRFNQESLSVGESTSIFRDYFSIFPWDDLPANSEGFDMGCGTGRWARFVAPQVTRLNCIDPSSSLEIARQNLSAFPNVIFHSSFACNSNLLPSSQDFGYSLGVLHHVPDTLAAIKSCTKLLKPGAPLLLYLYYAFDNRPRWFRYIWHVSNFWRLQICRLPPRPKQFITDIIALTIYWPLASVSRIAERIGLPVSAIPLSYYRKCSFYTMRTDSRDRFGTPLEKRFSKKQIIEMCAEAGLVDLRFSNKAPFWCVIGFKAKN